MPFPGYAGGWNVQLDPSAVASGRTMLDLNDAAVSGIAIGASGSGQGIDWGQAQITEYLAQQGQWGSTVADFIVPNRTVTIPLGLGMSIAGPDANTALASLTKKVGLLQREGGWLVRRRRGGPAMYADVVSATLTVPDAWGETAGVEPGVTLTLECLPDFYGDEITTLDTLHCTGVCEQVLTVSGAPAVIDGDYPARCRIIVTDTSGKDQDGLLWAARARRYDPAATADLFYEAEAMTPLDAASAVAEPRGASGGAAVAHYSLIAGTWLPVLLTDLLSGGALTHQGCYRVWARCSAAASAPRLRLAWSPGDIANATINDPVALPAAGAWYPLSLGVVRIEAPLTGPSRWRGVIQAQGQNTGDTIEIDCLYLQPLEEGAGVLSAVQSNAVTAPQPDQSFIAGLNLPLGVAVDSSYIYWTDALTGSIGRANLDGTGVNRSLITGLNEPLGIAVDSSYIYWADPPVFGRIGRANLDGSGVNHAFVTGLSPQSVAVDSTYLYWADGATIGRANLDGSAPNVSFITAGAISPGVYYGLAVNATHIYWTSPNLGTVNRALLDGSGIELGLVSAPGGPSGLALDAGHVYWPSGSHGINRAQLDGSGAIPGYITTATGAGGVTVDAGHIYWANTPDGTIGRSDVDVLELPDAVIYGNGIAELRTEQMLRLDIDGDEYAPVSQVVGDMPRLPPSGLEDRHVQLLLKPSRGDLSTGADAGIDPFTVQVRYRPCWLGRP